MRILVVEDNRGLAANIGEFFELRGHTSDFATDGIAGLKLALANDYEVIVLDVMLPGMDGFELCRRLRQDAHKDAPVLFLTARDTLEDKLAGFGVGGDDYLLKPFPLLELEARLLALARRPTVLGHSRILKVADLSFDLDRVRISRAGKVISLPRVARDILELLMRASPRVVSRPDIEMQIWGDMPPDGDALRSHIYNIRNVIDKNFEQKLLHTIYGVGHWLGQDSSP